MAGVFISHAGYAAVPLSKILFLLACVITAAAVTAMIGMMLSQVINLPWAWLIPMPTAMVGYITYVFIETQSRLEDEESDRD